MKTNTLNRGVVYENQGGPSQSGSEPEPSREGLGHQPCHPQILGGRETPSARPRPDEVARNPRASSGAVASVAGRLRHHSEAEIVASQALREMKERREGLRHKLRLADTTARQSKEYRQEHKLWLELGETIQRMTLRRIYARPAEPLDHEVTVKLTASQYAILLRVARYDADRRIEDTGLAAIKLHCTTYLSSVRGLPEWEASAKFDGGKAPCRSIASDSKSVQEEQH